MPAANLSDPQRRVLGMVVATAPHATLSGLSYMLEARPNDVQRSLDALTRRGFVTPVRPTRLVGDVELEQDGEAYVATVKGRRRVVQ